MRMVSRLQPYGIDLFCLGKKFLVFNLVSRNLKIKYRRSILGAFWTFLSPLAVAVVYYFVFKVILNVRVPHYFAFLLGGALPWAFFSQTILEGTESIVGNWGLISKVPVPVQVFPYVGALTNLVTLSLALPIIIGSSVISGIDLNFSILLIIPFFLCLFLIAYSLSLILAVAFVYFRDLRHLTGIIVQIWFYATPVLYEESMIPEKYRWIIFANPVGAVFNGIHAALGGQSVPSLSHVLVIIAWTLSIVFISAFLQKHVGSDVVERI